jgi:hypothetical protein
MQLKMVARPSRLPPVGVPPTGPGSEPIHFLVNPFWEADAFGETPKAAGEDARAPQSFCIVTALSSHFSVAQHGD